MDEAELPPPDTTDVGAGASGKLSPLVMALGATAAAILLIAALLCVIRCAARSMQRRKRAGGGSARRRAKHTKLKGSEASPAQAGATAHADDEEDVESCRALSISAILSIT